MLAGHRDRRRTGKPGRPPRQRGLPHHDARHPRRRGEGRTRRARRRAARCSNRSGRRLSARSRPPRTPAATRRPLAAGEKRSPSRSRRARALEAMGAAREEAARAEERYEGGKRRLADVAHEIREMLEVEPEEVAACRHRPGQGAARRRRDRGQPGTASSRRERLGAVNLRAEEELREVETQHAHAHHRARRSGRGDQAAAAGHPEPQPRSARTAARLLRGGQRPFPAPVHAAVRRRRRGTAADRSTTIRWRPASKSSPRPPGKKPRRCRCSPAASRRSPRSR